jgi:hypothetical protein
MDNPDSSELEDVDGRRLGSATSCHLKDLAQRRRANLRNQITARPIPNYQIIVDIKPDTRSRNLAGTRHEVLRKDVRQFDGPLQMVCLLQDQDQDQEGNSAREIQAQL